MRTRSLVRSAPWSQPSGRRSLRGGPYPARGAALSASPGLYIDFSLARPISRQVQPLDHDFLETKFVNVMYSRPVATVAGLESGRDSRRRVHFLGEAAGASVPVSQSPITSAFRIGPTLWPGCH